MVELLMVMAIITTLAVISVPVTRMFARNDLRDGARTIHTMLRAARMYAITWNVETAVVYSLDYPFTDGALDPAVDTLRNHAVRAIRAAAVMYKLPAETNVQPYPPEGAPDINWRGTFTHIPRSDGFVPLPAGHAILLETAREEYKGSAFDAVVREEAAGEQLYNFDYDLTPFSYHLEYNPAAEPFLDHPNAEPQPMLDRLGMMPVHAHPGSITVAFNQATDQFSLDFEPELTRPYIAHVFTRRGSLKTRTQRAERYRFLVALAPDQVAEDRLVEYYDNEEKITRFRLLAIPIEIHRGTGRVNMGS